MEARKKRARPGRQAAAGRRCIGTGCPVWYVLRFGLAGGGGDGKTWELVAVFAAFFVDADKQFWRHQKKKDQEGEEVGASVPYKQMTAVFFPKAK